MYVYIYMICMYTVILDTSGHWIFSKHIPFGINALKLSVSLKLIHIFIWVSQPLPYPPHGGLFCQMVLMILTASRIPHHFQARLLASWRNLLGKMAWMRSVSRYRRRTAILRNPSVSACYGDPSSRPKSFSYGDEQARCNGCNDCNDEELLVPRMPQLMCGLFFQLQSGGSWQHTNCQANYL